MASSKKASKIQRDFGTMPMGSSPIRIPNPPQRPPNSEFITGGYDFVTAPVYLNPDPFGIQAVLPTLEESVDIQRKISWHQRFSAYMTAEINKLKNRTMHAFTARRSRENVLENNTVRGEEPGESGEDIGTRKARAVSRSWGRNNLKAIYICLVMLVGYYSLGALYSVIIMSEAMHDFAMRGEIKFYQYGLALSMLDVSKVIGIFIFAKLTTAESRPLALLVAILITTGGLALLSFSITWESFSAGGALFNLGASGVTLVSQIIVADNTDLSWRGASLWGLEVCSVLWIWTMPAVTQAIVGKIQWNVPIWVFFTFSIPVVIAALFTSYIPHRRAKHSGLFPPLKNSHNHLWFNPWGTLKKIQLLCYDLDIFGMFLSVLGLGSLSTVLALSEDMRTGIGIWMFVLLVSGCLSMFFLHLWERWLNRDIKTEHKAPLQRAQHYNQGQYHSRVTWDALPGERQVIMGPAVPVGYDSFLAEQSAAEMSARIIKSQDKNETKGWIGLLSSYKVKCSPLFKDRLVRENSIFMACMIISLANFATRIGRWTIWDSPEDLPIQYRKAVEYVQGNSALEKIEYTSFVIGGFFAALLTRLTKTDKPFVTGGLFLMIIGLLIFQRTEIHLIQTLQIFMSQAIIGFGAGMAWICLTVDVQASCKKHSDVGMSIALFSTSNEIGAMAAGAVKRWLQAHTLNMLSPKTSQEHFLVALSSHWSLMLILAIVAVVIALLMTIPGLERHDLDKVKQHVSGIVFGRDDASRHNLDFPDEQDSSRAPSSFFSTHEVQDVPQNVVSSSPSMNVYLERMSAPGGRRPIPIGKRRNFNANQVVMTAAGYPKAESTDRDTAPPRPVLPLFRVPSGSSGALSLPRTSGSFEEVFSMELETDFTPPGTSFRNGETSHAPGMGPSVSQPIDPLEPDSSLRYYRDRLDFFKGKKTGIIPSESMRTISPRGGGLPKEKIDAENIHEAHRTVSSHHTGEEGEEDDNDTLEELKKPFALMEWLKAPDPSNCGALDQRVADGAACQTSDTEIRTIITHNGASTPNPLMPKAPESGPVSTELSAPAAILSSDGERELIHRWRTWVDDGDISDIPSDAGELSDEEPTLPSCQLGISQITSEVRALTFKNSYTPEVPLATIEELSSQASRDNLVDMALIRGTDSHHETKSPLIVSVLSANHAQANKRHTSSSGDENNASSSKPLKKKAKRSKGKGKGRGKGKAKAISV